MCWFVLDLSASYEELLAGMDIVEKLLNHSKTTMVAPKEVHVDAVIA